MMTESSFRTGPSSQPSFTELPSQAPHVPDHAPWMDLSAQISFLGLFEHLVQRIERLESRQESQHEEMMAYLYSVFPPPPPQP
ncbi:hypothetical protein CK203_028291 [Vitis vinifera]|uniref:Uncharacterized protein n=1 Tax=Vitis vinifera TaxID=29760 RepID=A0A438IZV7_VITVI|nr:hypothetical protein CK203_028291 [Vitis vinifera]